MPKRKQPNREAHPMKVSWDVIVELTAAMFYLAWTALVVYLVLS